MASKRQELLAEWKKLKKSIERYGATKASPREEVMRQDACRKTDRLPLNSLQPLRQLVQSSALHGRLGLLEVPLVKELLDVEVDCSTPCLREPNADRDGLHTSVDPVLWLRDLAEYFATTRSGVPWCFSPPEDEHRSCQGEIRGFCDQRPIGLCNNLICLTGV